VGGPYRRPVAAASAYASARGSQAAVWWLVAEVEDGESVKGGWEAGELRDKSRRGGERANYGVGFTTMARAFTS
jgi:hypothetical protein